VAQVLRGQLQVMHSYCAKPFAAFLPERLVYAGSYFSDLCVICSGEHMIVRVGEAIGHLAIT